MGHRQQITIDDQLATNGKDKLIFLESRGYELWGMLLEKAWAKQIGGYSRLYSDSFGLPHYALEYFTGASTSILPLSKDLL